MNGRQRARRALMAVAMLPLLLGAPASKEAPARQAPPATIRFGPLRFPKMRRASGGERPAAPRVRPASPAIAPCEGTLPAPGAGRPPFGERLRYDLEVMGVRAGSLSMRWRPDGKGAARIEVEARTNTFFENVRKLEASATSFVSRSTLRPTRYREDAVEDGQKKWAEVRFHGERREVEIHYAYGKREHRRNYAMSTGPHDLLSAIFYLRSLDLGLGQSFCIDVYGNRRVWRVRGRVESEEWVSTPVGRLKTYRLSGKASRIDYPKSEKEIHLWIAQDEAHTPVAVLSEIDLGPISATLSGVRRPGGKGSRSADYGGGTW